jgi:hypothetical protein
MDKVNSFVIDWSIRFLENKDAIKGEIVKVEKGKEGYGFIINYKDQIKYFIVKLILGKGVFDKIKNDKYHGIFTLNNPENIRFVVSNWDRLIGFKFLNIYFVNPFSKSDKSWTLCPYIHYKVCDKSSLETGLKSMAEMVNFLSLEELNNKVK